MSFKRKSQYEALRCYQTLISGVRERTVKAISFSKLLRKDLEVSAEFSITGSIGEVLNRLQETDHVQV
jgi:mitogen-activated protein kinase kinase kinase 4